MQPRSTSGEKATADLLLGDHCLGDKVLQLLIGEVDAQLLKAVYSKILRSHTKELLGHTCHLDQTYNCRCQKE